MASDRSLQHYFQEKGIAEQIENYYRTFAETIQERAIGFDENNPARFLTSSEFLEQIVDRFDQYYQYHMTQQSLEVSKRDPIDHRLSEFMKTQIGLAFFFDGHGAVHTPTYEESGSISREEAIELALDTQTKIVNCLWDLLEEDNAISVLAFESREEHILHLEHTLVRNRG